MSLRIRQPLRIKAVVAKCSTCGFRIGRIPLWAMNPYQVSINCPICGNKGIETLPAKPFTRSDTVIWTNLIAFWEMSLVPSLKYDTNRWVLDTVEFDMQRRASNSRQPGT